MAVVNFGSINIDHVYRVDHISRPGETIASIDYSLFPGGKGANQSVAIARAGGSVVHVGKIGHDAMWMSENMRKDGVDTTRIAVESRPSGHAIIQVDKNGQNSIVIHGGTNREFETTQIEDVLGQCADSDIILAQNEINNIPAIMEGSARRGLKLCFNPAPMGPEVFDYPLDAVSTFISNQSEGEALAKATEPEKILSEMRRRYPKALVILTLGGKGAMFSDGTGTGSIVGRVVKAVDTTAAGDTFIGYLLAGLQKNMGLDKALAWANAAAAICVTRQGAASSIPWAREIV